MGVWLVGGGCCGGVCVCVGGGLPFSFAHLPPLKRKDTSLLLASSSRMSRSVSCLFEIP